MLYIFDQNENLIALLKPDFNRSTGPATTSRAFLSAAFPAEFDREPTEGCPYWDAVHREVLNGENTFTFTVPADRADAAYVAEGNLVAFKDLDAYWQFFEIKRLVDLHGDGLTRTAYCEHILYELIDDIVTDKRPSSTAVLALTGMLEDTRWQVGIVDDLGTSSTSAYYVSALEAIQSVANAWGGELHWRCVINGGTITRYVDLLAMRGADTGKQFAYSKDVLSIEREVDTSSIATALYGRGKGVELDSGAYGRRLTFTDVIAADKPLGQEWIGDSDALIRWGRPGGRHRFDVFIDEEEDDPIRLLAKTRAELARRKVPRVTYRLDVVSLEELTDYEHEQVRLGDLVRVIDREFKPELVVSARVIDIERDLLAPENTKVVLGSFSPTIVDATINTQRQVSDLQNRPFNTAWLDGAINILQNEINNSSAYVYQTADGILIMDAPTFAEATKAMKLGGGVFALANSKQGDVWNWRAFGTGAGFNADEMITGTLRADLVKILGDTHFYWDGGAIYMVDPDDINNQVKLNKYGLHFTTDQWATTQTALNSSGLNIRIPDNLLQEGVSYNDVEIGTLIGVKASHVDGSYTQLSGAGLTRFYAEASKVWSSSTSYSKNDIVAYYSDAYICLAASTNKQPNLYPDYWAVVPHYGADVEYTNGDYVIYDGNAYKHENSTTTGEPPTNATHWTFIDTIFSGYLYHFRSVAGSAATTGESQENGSENEIEDVWVTLPDDFKNKNFIASVSFKNAGLHGWALSNLKLEVIDYDRPNGKFKVRGRAMGNLYFITMYGPGSYGVAYNYTWRGVGFSYTAQY